MGWASRARSYAPDNPLAGRAWETRPIEWASPQQATAFRYGPAPLCLSGGYGSGKTVGAILKGLRLSDLYPRNRGVIARRVGKELEATTKPTFFKYCPPQAYEFGRRNDQAGIVRLNNGSEILFLHMDKPEIETIIAGLEINWFILDQAEEMNEEIFTKLSMRLGRWDQAIVSPELITEYELRNNRRWPWYSPGSRLVLPKPIPPTYSILTVNPEEEDHWVYTKFHKDSQQWQENHRLKGFAMIEMPSNSNRFLPAQNLEHMLGQDQDYIDRYVHGRWGRPRGVIHTINPQSIVVGSAENVRFVTNYCNLYRFLDHGDSAPTCCLWMAADGRGNIIFYREYYQPGELVSKHRQDITDLSEGERYQGNFADPEIVAPKQQSAGRRWSIAEEYSRIEGSLYPASTAIPFTAADNNELATRVKLNNYLSIDPEHHNPFTGEKGAPHLYFIQQSEQYAHGCYYAIKQIKAQKRIIKGYVSGVPIFSEDRNESVPDHAYDPVRYGVASRPSLAGSIELVDNQQSSGLEIHEGIRRRLRAAQSGARRSILNELLTGSGRLPF